MKARIRGVLILTTVFINFARDDCLGHTTAHENTAVNLGWNDIVARVRWSGFNLLTLPVLVGTTYAMSATGKDGTKVHILVSAKSGDILAIDSADGSAGDHSSTPREHTVAAALGHPRVKTNAVDDRGGLLQKPAQIMTAHSRIEERAESNSRAAAAKTSTVANVPKLSHRQPEGMIDLAPKEANHHHDGQSKAISSESRTANAVMAKVDAATKIEPQLSGESTDQLDPINTTTKATIAATMENSESGPLKMNRTFGKEIGQQWNRKDLQELSVPAHALTIEGVASNNRSAVIARPRDPMPHSNGVGGVTLLVAIQKTATPRISDIERTPRRNRIGRASRLAWLRMRDDKNFVNKTRELARRLKSLNPRGPFAKLESVINGAEFIDALTKASRNARIKNLVVYGHAAPKALYMMEDRGFYKSVGEVARNTRVTGGTDPEKEKTLRMLGARDLNDLEARVRSREIQFENDAVIFFSGCEVAGVQDIDRSGIAAGMAKITGATVIASIGPTDQSIAERLGRARENEYSRGTWAKFAKNVEPRKLNIKMMDPLGYLNWEPSPVNDSRGGFAVGSPHPVLADRLASYPATSRSVPLTLAQPRSSQLGSTSEDHLLSEGGFDSPAIP
jgi:hypothetical protein